MKIWIEWCRCVFELRAACSRNATFLWMALVLLGLTVRSDLAGVTSFVRAAFVHDAYYHALLHLFHSSALKLDLLLSLWVRMSLRLLSPVVVDGYTVLIADGLKAPKEGRKMPAVKSLHQESTNNSKATYIMGHSFQAIALLASGGKERYFAVPLLSRICEGLVFSNRDRRSLLDKLANLFLQVAVIADRPCLLVADAYYASRKVIEPLLGKGHHLLVRTRINSVAYRPAPAPRRRKRGRPRIYGDKVCLRTLFDQRSEFQSAPSPVYAERNVTIAYRCVDLLWRPVGRLVRFVLVQHPTRGRMILLCSCTTLDPMTVIRLYGLRFKIEVSFKQAIHTLGAYAYRFWMKDLEPIRKGAGNQHLHRRTENYRRSVRRKIDAYHRWVQLGCIAQGLLQHLALNFHVDVWAHFRSWLRTMNPDTIPSEQVVAQALRASLPEFLLDTSNTSKLKKFILDRAAADRMPGFRMLA